MSKVPNLSVVVPVYNEEENVAKLVDEIAVALKGEAYEMIFVNDASSDGTLEKLKNLKAKYPALRPISHRKNAGQSRAVRSGVMAAKGVYIATLDGDGQNDPADIPALYAQITRKDAPQSLALVGGRRAKRQDSWAKKIGSRFGNGIRKKLLKDKAIHRYIPALMLREGYEIEFCDVNHRHREFGVSKYTNLGRLIVSIADLRGVMWLNRRARNPEGWDEV